MGRKKLVSVCIDAGVVEEIDELCEITGVSRSKMWEKIFRYALRRFGRDERARATRL